jgi:hypothetical protein
MPSLQLDLKDEGHSESSNPSDRASLDGSFNQGGPDAGPDVAAAASKLWDTLQEINEEINAKHNDPENPYKNPDENVVIEHLLIPEMHAVIEQMRPQLQALATRISEEVEQQLPHVQLGMEKDFDDLADTKSLLPSLFDVF